jgi:hypothetical protein
MRWFLILFAASLLAEIPDCQTLFPARPCTEPPCQSKQIFWIGDVSLLAWQAREEGLDFALKNTPPQSDANVNVDGSLVGIDFDWMPAFKVTVGAAFAERAWDAQFRWTYFHTHSSRTVQAATAANSAGLLPLWAFPNADIASQFLYGKAHGALGLNLNGFDVEMGYWPYLSPSVSLRFTAGLKILSIHQHFKVKYSDGFEDEDTQLLDAKTSVDSDTVGAGPRISFDSKWRLARGFSILASLAGSLPLLQHLMTRTDSDFGIEAETAETINSFFKEGFWIFQPVLETSLGFGWDTCFGCRKNYPFGLAASYEFQYFPEQNMMPLLINPGILNQVYHQRGDLHLHGATLTFHFGF